MEAIYALAVGLMAGAGIYLILRPRTFQVIIGLSLLAYAVNLFIFAMGRLRQGVPPIIDPLRGSDPALYADPLPQALVLTAIVISMAMTAVLLVMAVQARVANANSANATAGAVGAAAITAAAVIA